MLHIEEGQLHALLDDALEPGAAESIRQHIAACSDCAARLEEERALRSRSIAILDVARPLASNAPPFETVLQRATTPPRRAVGMPGPTRMAWAATIVLALGIGWFARDFAPRAPQQGALQSARSEDAQSDVQGTPSAAEAVAPAPPPTSAAPIQSAKGRLGPAAAVGGTSATENAALQGLRRERPPAEVSADQAQKAVAQNVAPNTLAVAQRSQLADSARQQQQRDAQIEAVRQAAASRGAGRGGVGVVQATAAATPSPQALRWEYMDLAQAEERIGRTVLVIPGLMVDSVGITPVQGGHHVRIVQRLPGDGVLELQQSPVLPPPTAARAEMAARPLESRADQAGFFTVSLQKSDVLLTGRARLQPDSIRVLLQRAR